MIIYLNGFGTKIARLEFLKNASSYSLKTVLEQFLPQNGCFSAKYSTAALHERLI